MGWGSAVFSILGVHSGNGKHFAILTKEQKSGAILWTMAGFCLGILSSGIPNLAIVFLLTRVFNPGRRHKIFLWCLATVCFLGLLVCVIVLFGRCIPARSLWDSDVTPDSCFSVWILVYYAIYAGSECRAIVWTADARTGELTAGFSLLRMYRFISCHLPNDHSTHFAEEADGTPCA